MAVNYPLYMQAIPLHLLNWHALQYAYYVSKCVELSIKQGKLKKSSRAYPACVACAQTTICGNIGYGKTKPFRNYHRLMHPILIGILETNLGVIGSSPNNGCNFTIGSCAEVHAVNNMMRKCESCKTQCTKLIDNMMVSAAYRPRTLEYIAPCTNCQTAFNL